MKTKKKFQSKDNYLVGVIADTHGHLPHSVAETFKGVDLIIHAGDIGQPATVALLQINEKSLRAQFVELKD